MVTPNNPRKYVGTDQYLVPFVTRTRQPLTSDFRQPETGNYYPIGCMWQVGKNPSTGVEGQLYFLSKIVANVAYWLALDSSLLANTFITDVANNTTSGPGTVTPVAGVIQILGRDSTQDNDNGIRTDADPNLGNIAYVELTNRLQGSVSTAGAATQTIITFALGSTPASYMFEITLTGFDTTTPTCTSYWFVAGARTTGAAATVVGTNETFNEDSVLGASDVNMIASGNNVLLQVTGVATYNLNWKAVGTYVRSI